MVSGDLLVLPLSGLLVVVGLYTCPGTYACRIFDVAQLPDSFRQVQLSRVLRFGFQRPSIPTSAVQAPVRRPEPLNQVAEKEQTVMDRVVTQLETFLLWVSCLDPRPRDP